MKRKAGSFGNHRGVWVAFLLVMLSGPAYSAVTTVIYQVSAGPNDGFAWSAASQDTTSAFLKIGNERTYAVPYQMSAMRFGDVNIPRSAIITSAYLKINSINTDYRGQIYGVISAEASDNPADFSGRLIGNAVLTTASVAWDFKDAWSPDTQYISGNISNVIQEVVNRGGFGSGNSIAIYYSTRDLSGKARGFASYEYSPALAAVLEVTYETYTISGHILTTEAAGLEGVSVSAGADIEGDVTDANGYYELKVPPGWSGTVTPSKTDWGFSPVNLPYSNVSSDQVSEDYTAFQPVISGYVKDGSGTGIEGVSVSADNGGGSDTTDATGYYEIVVPYNWTGMLSASLAGYNFTSKTYNTPVIADQTNQDFTGFQPKISGYVNDGVDSGVEGVLVSADNGGGSETTDSNGYYAIKVPYDWSGNVSVSKQWWVFSPTSRSYNNIIIDQTGQDYYGNAPLTISGYVTYPDGSGVGAVEVNANNDGRSSITSYSGYYTVIIPYNWSGTVTPSRGSLNFEPINRTYTLLTENTDQENYVLSSFNTIILQANGGGDYPNIQSAINAASDGDIIILEQGTYRGNGNRDLSFNGKAIVIQSNDPWDDEVVSSTIIDCQGTENDSHRGFYFDSNESPGTVISGFTIMNGYATSGAGIFCGENTSPVIKRCIIRDNFANGNGGSGAGIFFFLNSGATITNCVIRDNYAQNSGGGIVCYWYSDVAINNCLIINNSATYAGGGIFCNKAGSTIINSCTITGNFCTSSGSSGGGIQYYNTSTSIHNSIFWGNNSVGGHEIALTGGMYTSHISLSYCNVEGGLSEISYGGNSTVTWDQSNMNIDPLFVDPESDYRLGFGSPCINAGDPNYIFDPCEKDLEGDFRIIYNRVDIGADEAIPKIVGQVETPVGTFVEGVLISTDNNDFSDTTDSNGFYEISVPLDWTGTVTASYGMWVFDPNVREYSDIRFDVTVQNYIGYAPLLISGSISDSLGNPTEGVLVSTDNSADSDTTDVNGYYEVPVPYNWSGTLTASKDWWVFEPNSVSYSNIVEDTNNQDFVSFAPPVISGHIKNTNGLGIGSVQVWTKDGIDSTLTDVNGYYELTVPQSWTGTVTLSIPDWRFEPNETSYVNLTTDQLNQDYTAYPPPIISGYVKETNGAGVETVVVNTDDYVSLDVTDVNGYYELTVPQNWSGKVIPDKGIWVFDPSVRNYSDLTSDISDQNFVGYDSVSISGYVKDINGVDINGARLYSDDGGYSETTDINGYYEFEVEYGWSGSIIIRKIRWEFEPESHSYNELMTDVIDQNFVGTVTNIINVKADGTGDAETIQAAIDAAVDGDEVIIHPGIYNGLGNYNIYFVGKAITVRSIDPEDRATVAATVIDAEYRGTGFMFYGGYDANSVLDGVTIKRTNGAQFGGGIECWDSSPTIRNCVISDFIGSGITLLGSNAKVKNCIIQSGKDIIIDFPHFTPGAYGINSYSSSPEVSDCLIRGNETSGFRCSGGEPILINCIFSGNQGTIINPRLLIPQRYGGGVLFEGGRLTIENCTFTGNKAAVGGGVCNYAGSLTMNNVTINNCIFWGSEANNGPLIALKIGGQGVVVPAAPVVSVSYSDIQGGEAAVYVDPCCTLVWDDVNNLDIDPCFAEPGSWHPNDTPGYSNDDFWVDGDYHLKSAAGRWRPLMYVGIDLTGDGFINLADFAAFADYWNEHERFEPPPPPPRPPGMPALNLSIVLDSDIPADFDKSGKVDFWDLGSLLDYYLDSYSLGEWVTDDVTSPCIDAGDVNSDWTEELWQHGKRINMGAYGGTPQGSMSLSTVGNKADVNNDGIVDARDLALLGDMWLAEDVLCAEDIDRNGSIDFSDIAEFGESWRWEE